MVQVLVDKILITAIVEIERSLPSVEPLGTADGTGIGRGSKSTTSILGRFPAFLELSAPVSGVPKARRFCEDGPAIIE